MLKIHLIYNDTDTGYLPNLNHGIAFLAGAIKNAGHDFTFHHVTTPESPQAVATRALLSEADVICFSLCHNQRRQVKQYVEQLRKLHCNALLVAGGIYPTTDPEDALEYLDVDAIAVGESELTFIGFLDALENNPSNKRNMPGIIFRSSEKNVKYDIPHFKTDITQIPLPDYSIFDLDNLVTASGGWMTMLLTRGCPYNCFYCCNSILKDLYPEKIYFRVPSVEHAIKLIKHNLSYIDGVKGIAFDDDLLCLKKDWFIEFAALYKEEINLPYLLNARIETLTDEIIEAMRSSGCRIVNIGVESGNPEVREKLLNRRYSNQQLITGFSKLKKAGIWPSTFNMVGLPFETKQQMLDTLNLNIALKPYRGSCFYFYPYPKTKLYDICKDNNLFTKEYKHVNGYFTAPSIKMTNCEEKDVIRVCEKLRLYLYMSRVLHSIKMEHLLNVIYYLAIPFAGILSKMLLKNNAFKRVVKKLTYISVMPNKYNVKRK